MPVGWVLRGQWGQGGGSGGSLLCSCHHRWSPGLWGHRCHPCPLQMMLWGGPRAVGPRGMGLGTNLGTRLGSEPAAPSLIHAPSCPASAGHEGDEWGWEEQPLPQLGVMGLGAHLGSRSSPK